MQHTSIQQILVFHSVKKTKSLPALNKRLGVGTAAEVYFGMNSITIGLCPALSQHCLRCDCSFWRFCSNLSRRHERQEYFSLFVSFFILKCRSRNPFSSLTPPTVILSRQVIINSTITPNMTFTKTSQKFGQWADSRANTVFGLGFASEQQLAKVSGDAGSGILERAQQEIICSHLARSHHRFQSRSSRENLA